MRVYKCFFSVLLITISLSAKSQSADLLRRIAIDSLNDRFARPKESDHTLMFVLDKSGKGELQISGKQMDSSINEQLLNVFRHYEDSLMHKWGYRITLYWDTLANRQFSMLHRQAAPAPASFSNPMSIAYPKGHTDAFFHLIWTDLKPYQATLEHGQEELWEKPFSFMVDTPNIFQQLPGHAWNGMLNKALHSEWYPTIYYGEVPITIIQVRVKKEWVLSDRPDTINNRDRFDYSKSFALREKFKGQLVGWQPYFNYKRPLTRKDILVSAVYNHMSDRLEAAMIHSGDTSEASTFIKWLQKQHMPLSRFYLFEDTPELKRSYFYLYE